MPAGWHNVIDLQTAIELFTSVYQLFLTDNDFWRATNSLQLDETIAIYVARILVQPHNLMLLNNKHPLVPESTLRAGHRLVLHAGLRCCTSSWCARSARTRGPPRVPGEPPNARSVAPPPSIALPGSRRVRHLFVERLPIPQAAL
jgi:hypothetical protein